MSPFTQEPEVAKTREWTIIMDDNEVADLIVLMLRGPSIQSGIPPQVFLMSMLSRGIEDQPNIVDCMPLLAAIITEKRRLDSVE